MSDRPRPKAKQHSREERLIRRMIELVDQFNADMRERQLRALTELKDVLERYDSDPALRQKRHSHMPRLQALHAAIRVIRPQFPESADLIEVACGIAGRLPGRGPRSERTRRAWQEAAKVQASHPDMTRHRIASAVGIDVRELKKWQSESEYLRCVDRHRQVLWYRALKYETANPGATIQELAAQCGADPKEVEKWRGTDGYRRTLRTKKFTLTSHPQPTDPGR